jgi:hypothetical protein
MWRTLADLRDQTLKLGGKRNLTMTDGLQNLMSVGTGESPAMARARKNLLPMAGPLNLPRVTQDERLTGIAWPVTLSARRRRAAGPPYFMDDRYDGTDHQAFDPNRDNRHFKRGNICGLLGRLGASRILDRLRG